MQTMHTMRKEKIFWIAAGFLILTAFASFGCEFTYTIADNAGHLRVIIPGESIILEEGQEYTLLIHFREDHGNCELAPQETDFLLEEEKWKTSKDYLPLQLLSDPVWTEKGPRDHKTELRFIAMEAGPYQLEIIRDCAKKEGYDESLLFSVR